jgi:hypothetical protein
MAPAVKRCYHQNLENGILVSAVPLVLDGGPSVTSDRARFWEKY